MPRFRKGETIAAEPSPAPLPELTRELLDTTITNITTILRTPESLFVPRRAKQSLADALKKLDLFYPVVLEVESDQATRGEVGDEGLGPLDQHERGGPDGPVYVGVGREGSGDGPAAPFERRGAQQGP